MRKIYLVLLVIAVGLNLNLNAQQPTQSHDSNDGHNHNTGITTNTTDFLKVSELEFDFGKIPQGKPVYHNFQVTNTGTEALKLDNVQASCGCTTPEWSHDPIAPATSAIIKVGYNAVAEGLFDKIITITYNNQSKQIRIKGTVWRAPDGPAPANASIDLLKKQSL